LGKRRFGRITISRDRDPLIKKPAGLHLNDAGSPVLSAPLQGRGAPALAEMAESQSLVFKSLHLQRFS
jgi:hypothetical protein